MRFSRGKIILILILMSISIGMMVYSFAYTTVTHTGTTSNYLTVSSISFGLTDSTTSVNLGEQTPTIDKFGLENAPFTFSITNTSTTAQNYTVRLDDKTVSSIPNSEVRYQLTVAGVAGDVRTLSESGAIDSGVIAGSTTISYSLRVWLSHDSDKEDGTWDKVVLVEAGSTNIDNSGANEPMLRDGMIPVYYDDDDEVWKKADITNSNIEYEWYNYDDRKWANAVTVSSTNRSTYVDATPGTVIPMDDINFMWVWIPRFKYTMFNKDFGTVEEQIIDVKFERGASSSGTMICTRENGIETCEDKVNGSIINGKSTYTHPAFTFGAEELTGIWVSKFELSADSSEACSTSVNTTNCNKSNLVLSSKPNKKSLYYISLSNLFKSTRSMELSGNIYGLTNGGSQVNNDGYNSGDNNDYDTHAIKSMEMGALVYLTYSNYGKYTNGSYKDTARKVFNNSSATTGKSYVDNVSYDYNVAYYGTGASTTGNIYGVYDLSSTVSEYVMSNSLNSTNAFNVSSSGLDASLDSMYYDAYLYTTSSNETVSLYGDAIREIKGFSTSSSSLPYSSSPFVRRTSVEVSTYANGSSTYNYGGRAVLTVEQDIYITNW